MKSDVFQIDNIAVKFILFEQVGDFMRQHVHKFPHYHYVLSGVVILIVREEDGTEVKTEHDSTSVIEIPAGKAHTLYSKTPNARSMCSHILTPDEMGKFDFESVIV